MFRAGGSAVASEEECLVAEAARPSEALADGGGGAGEGARKTNINKP